MFLQMHTNGHTKKDNINEKVLGCMGMICKSLNLLIVYSLHEEG